MKIERQSNDMLAKVVGRGQTMADEISKTDEHFTAIIKQVSVFSLIQLVSICVAAVIKARLQDLFISRKEFSRFSSVDRENNLHVPQYLNHEFSKRHCAV